MPDRQDTCSAAQDRECFHCRQPQGNDHAPDCRWQGVVVERECLISYRPLDDVALLGLQRLTEGETP